MSDIKKYQPSNSSDGFAFIGKFCAHCIKHPISNYAKNQCGILCRTFIFNITDKEYPDQWRYVDGQPTCTAFKNRAEFNKERKRSKIRIIACDKTGDLFAG